MQVQTFHSFGFHLFATSRKAPSLFATVLVMGGVVALAGVTSQTALAQQLDTPPAVRDTFSINSGYFSKDYANNIDHAQFALDVRRASGRLALYGYDKFSDRVDGPFSRLTYFLGSGLVTGLTGIDLTYHEWGHASRTVAPTKPHTSVRLDADSLENLIKPCDKVEYKLDDLVAGMTAKNRHDEVSFGTPVGKEAL